MLGHAGTAGVGYWGTATGRAGAVCYGHGWDFKHRPGIGLQASFAEGAGSVQSSPSASASPQPAELSALQVQGRASYVRTVGLPRADARVALRGVARRGWFRWCRNSERPVGRLAKVRVEAWRWLLLASVWRALPSPSPSPSPPCSFQISPSGIATVRLPFVRQAFDCLPDRIGTRHGWQWRRHVRGFGRGDVPGPLGTSTRGDNPSG